MNLVNNAFDAVGSDGAIMVSTAFDAKDNEVIITIADTGSGIPQDRIDKIFDPFFTTKEVGRGTGLGLAVSHGIIARHKGTIRVQSRPDKGTSFIVRLPLNPKES